MVYLDLILQKLQDIQQKIGRYKDGARDASSDFLTNNFFFFTVDTNTATSGNVKGGGYGCSVGPVTIEA